MWLIFTYQLIECEVRQVAKCSRLGRARLLEKGPAELQVGIGGVQDAVVCPRAHLGVAPALEEVVAARPGRVVAGGAQAAGLALVAVPHPLGQLIPSCWTHVLVKTTTHIQCLLGV